MVLHRPQSRCPSSPGRSWALAWGPLSLNCSAPGAVSPVLPRPLEKNGNVFEMSPQDAHLLPGPVIPHSRFGWDQVRPASS